jgi:hypothetical protein
MIANCKGMNGMMPEEMNNMMGDNDCDINLPAFVDMMSSFFLPNSCNFNCLKITTVLALVDITLVGITC